MRLLYSNGSPFARRVRVLLLEKQLAFEADVYDGLRPVDVIRGDNPLLQVPVLFDGELRLFGTGVICDYLYATYPHMPGAAVPLASTVTRAGQHWEDRLTLDAIEVLTETIVNLRLLQADGPIRAGYVDRQRARVGSVLDWLEGRVTPEGVWPGVFSVMDIGLVAALEFAEKRGMAEAAVGGRKRIAAMMGYWADRPSLVATPVNVLAVGG